MTKNSVTGVLHQAESAAHQVKPWVNRLARLGFAAKGVLYLLVGFLAFQVAMGLAHKTTDLPGALVMILHQPYGKILLAVIAIGLAGYALWRLLEAWLDPEGEGTDSHGILTRLGYAFSGLVYGGLAVTATKLIFKAAHIDPKSAQRLTAHFLHLPFGQWIVGIVGVIVIAVGIYSLTVAFRASFLKHLEINKLGPDYVRWATHVGRLGYAARGVVFAVIGWYLMKAARQDDPSLAQGVDGAQRVISHSYAGAPVLCLVAAGLIAYGAFMFIEARYHRLRTR